MSEACCFFSLCVFTLSACKIPLCFDLNIKYYLEYTLPSSCILIVTYCTVWRVSYGHLSAECCSMVRILFFRCHLECLLLKRDRKGKNRIIFTECWMGANWRWVTLNEARGKLVSLSRTQLQCSTKWRVIHFWVFKIWCHSIKYPFLFLFGHADKDKYGIPSSSQGWKRCPSLLRAAVQEKVADDGLLHQRQTC